MYEHYQLTQFQHDVVMNAANSKNPLVMMLSPKEGDDADTTARLERQNREITDMVGLGFFKDTTGKILETVTDMELKTGRTIKAFILTDTGFDMFHKDEKERLPA